ncbi:hypothetical protein IQ07DRAFT_596080 [Pyrenochaeta sp. DS3sAY3a]|nr:hypothetical protein IQ07DRAFT_596080 [Pyrenochaeta sp. DS3sAY3a]
MEVTKRKPVWQLRRLTHGDFHENLASDNAEVSPVPAEKERQTPQEIRSNLLSARNSFAATIPVEGNEICYGPDRAAVLRVYQQGLEKITAANHKQVKAEVSLKVKTILCLREAEPEDVVFASKGMVLEPLEPQYAEPRIDFMYDQSGYTATKRLNRWRREGWPEVFPRQAIAVDRQLSEEQIEEEQSDWKNVDWDDGNDEAAIEASSSMR